MKKLLSILCAAALTLSLAACGSTAEDYVGQTLTGQVTAIDGSAVTLQLGELTEDANTPPDLPSGSSDAQPPPDGGSAPSGQAPDGGSDANTPPEKPGGGSSGDSFTENGETLTGDCVITSLTNNGTINFNGYTITLAGGTVLQ